MKHLVRWQPNSGGCLDDWTNYSGLDLSEWYTVYVQHRDSGLIDQSNFAIALAMLGDESPTVCVMRCTHWLVGWVEMLLVHESDRAHLLRAEEVLARLADFPVLDGEDLSMREAAAEDAAWHAWGRDEFRQFLQTHGMTDTDDAALDRLKADYVSCEHTEEGPSFTYDDALDGQ